MVRTGLHEFRIGSRGWTPRLAGKASVWNRESAQWGGEPDANSACEAATIPILELLDFGGFPNRRQRCFKLANGGGFAMGRAIGVSGDFTSGEVRQFARRAKDGAQARRLLAVAAVLDGASREEAALVGGMDRQTLRDWVIRFNEQGAGGSYQHAFTGRTLQARRRTQGLSRPDRRGRANPGNPRRGALAGQRSDRAVA